MSTRLLASFGGAILLLLPVGAAGEDETKPLTVELKSFKFPAGLSEVFGYNEGEGKLFLYTNGKAETTFKMAATGDYEIIVKASGDKALNEGAKFRIAVDDKDIGTDKETDAGEPKDFKFSTKLKAGDHKLSIEFTNDVYKEGEYDRNLYVHGVTISKVKK